MKRVIALLFSILLLCMAAVACADGSVGTDALVPGVSESGEVEYLTMKATCVEKGIKLEWNAITGAKQYTVMRRKSYGQWETLATIKKTSTTSYTDKKAEQAQTYEYYVTAKVDLGTKNSNYQTICYLQRVQLQKVQKGKVCSIDVSWKKTPDVNGYIVHYTNTKTKVEKTKKISDANTTSVTLEMLDSGVKYSVYVTAYKNVGSSAVYYSMPSVKKNVTTQKITNPIRKSAKLVHKMKPKYNILGKGDMAQLELEMKVVFQAGYDVLADYHYGIGTTMDKAMESLERNLEWINCFRTRPEEGFFGGVQGLYVDTPREPQYLIVAMYIAGWYDKDGTFHEDDYLLMADPVLVPADPAVSDALRREWKW